MKREVPKVFVNGKEMKGIVGMRMETSSGVRAWHKAPANPTGSDNLVVDIDAVRDHLRSEMPSPEKLEGE